MQIFHSFHSTNINLKDIEIRKSAGINSGQNKVIFQTRSKSYEHWKTPKRPTSLRANSAISASASSAQRSRKTSRIHDNRRDIAEHNCRALGHPRTPKRRLPEPSRRMRRTRRRPAAREKRRTWWHSDWGGDVTGEKGGNKTGRKRPTESRRVCFKSSAPCSGGALDLAWSKGI